RRVPVRRGGERRLPHRAVSRREVAMRALVLGLVLAVAVTPASARRVKVTPPSRLSLVQAQCPTVPPGPCSPTFTFTGGTATLIGQTGPQAACHPPAQPKGGQV